MHRACTTTPDAWNQHLKPWRKRLFWKGERQAEPGVVAEQLEDQYTAREALADECYEHGPCAQCQEAEARRGSPQA